MRVGAAITNTNASPTPPGFNKNKRDSARLFLLIVTISLFLGYYILSIIFSMISILTLKEGTGLSIKNMKWMTLSVISLVASLIASQMYYASMKVDEEKAYSLKICLNIIAQSTRIIWASFLGLLLLSASHSNVWILVLIAKKFLSVAWSKGTQLAFLPSESQRFIMYQIFFYTYGLCIKMFYKWSILIDNIMIWIMSKLTPHRTLIHSNFQMCCIKEV